MAYSNPSIADFKGYFTRDFPYSADPADGVTDQDIANAMQRTNITINQTLFPDGQANFTIGYYYLTAHFLVTAIQVSGQGLFGKGTAGVEQSKSVGSVSQSFAIPQSFLENPFFAGLSKTAYGLEYFNMIYPYLVGKATYAHGRTLP